MERYPENTQIGIDDFRRSEWRTAVDAPKKYGYYYSLWQSLSELVACLRDNVSITVPWRSPARQRILEPRASASGLVYANELAETGH
jgi:hypothetical protein